MKKSPTKVHVDSSNDRSDSSSDHSDSSSDRNDSSTDRMDSSTDCVYFLSDHIDSLSDRIDSLSDQSERASESLPQHCRSSKDISSHKFCFLIIGVMGLLIIYLCWRNWELETRQNVIQRAWEGFLVFWLGN